MLEYGRSTKRVLPFFFFSNMLIIRVCWFQICCQNVFFIKNLSSLNLKFQKLRFLTWLTPSENGLKKSSAEKSSQFRKKSVRFCRAAMQTNNCRLSPPTSHVFSFWVRRKPCTASARKARDFRWNTESSVYDYHPSKPATLLYIKHNFWHYTPARISSLLI